MNNLGIAFDLGTEKTGLFIVRDGDFAKGRPITLKTSANEHRQFAMAEKIGAVLDQFTDERPDWACFEDIYLGKNPHTYRQLVGLRAIIEHEIWRMPILRIYAATTVEIDGSCNLIYPKGGRKAATMRFAELLNGAMGQDAADALCTGYHGYHVYKSEMIAEGLWQ